MSVLECAAIYLLLGSAVAVWMRAQILPIKGVEDAAITVIALVGVVVVWPVSAYLRLTAHAVDTHPKDGDAKQAPGASLSGAVGEAETPQ